MLLNVLNYVNFSTPDGFVSMPVLIWSLYIGFMLAMTAATVDKFFCLRFVKGLSEKGAVSEETALSLEELDIGGKWYLRFALKKGKPLTKMVSSAESENTARYFLPEDLRLRAELRYENGNRPVRSLILCGILLLVLAILMQAVIPELLIMLDNLITQFNS